MLTWSDPNRYIRRMLGDHSCQSSPDNVVDSPNGAADQRKSFALPGSGSRKGLPNQKTPMPAPKPCKNTRRLTPFPVS